jgi:hypothetical protein
MRFAKSATFEQAFALCRREGVSIYIAIAEKGGCEYQFHPDGACDRITEYCPVCSRTGVSPNRIQKGDHLCPNCGRDYTPQPDHKTDIARADEVPQHLHAA